MTDPMARFSRREFDALSQAERLERCRELARVLSERLEASSDFEDGVAAIISDLRQGGHDLWSFDEDIGRQVWGRDYTKRSPPGLLLEFYAPHEVDVTWEGEQGPDRPA